MYNRNLIEYLPEFLREVKENKAILTMAEQPEMVTVWEALDNALKDQFVVDATENGVSRWENILKITPNATDTLESRKFAILTRINEQIPFTLTSLNEQLKSFCGEGNYEVRLDSANYKLSVAVALAVSSNLQDIEALLNRIVPANLIIELSIKYNRHEKYLATTHEVLGNSTHYQLRNEVDE